MKILYVTTIGITMNFFKSFIQELKDSGDEVHIACNDSLSPVSDFYKDLGCYVHSLSCTRSPFNFMGIWKAIREIKRLVEKEEYDIVHCHTPVAALCTRLACVKVRKKGVKVFYTAHGFHFYKGAPLKNWLLYYPIEKICSRITDVLITINKEDYRLAQKRLSTPKVEYIMGVGINTDFFANAVVKKDFKREEINVPKNAFLMLSVGELNTNKNHMTVISALPKLNNENIHYAIAGTGDLDNEIMSYAKKIGVADRVHLLGQRCDVAELYKIADCYVHPSFREGLPVAVMEAIAAGLPVIVSNVRGNVDLVDNDTGYIFKSTDRDDFCKVFSELENDIANHAVRYNRNISRYDVKAINNQLYSIYVECKGNV